MADFCTIDDVREFLQLDIDEESKIASCMRAIVAATAAIRNYCHQEIELSEDDEITLDCWGGQRLFLPQVPVVSVSSVVEDGDSLTAGSDEDYQLGQYGILYRVGKNWASGVQIVTAVYTHGYETIPDDVVDVCTRAASRAFQAGLRASEMDGVPGIVSTSLGDFAVSFGAEGGGGVSEGVMGASASRMLLLSEKDTLNRYRYVAQ